MGKVVRDKSMPLGLGTLNNLVVLIGFVRSKYIQPYGDNTSNR